MQNKKPLGVRLKKLKVPFVPSSLKMWFVVHCILDLIFAVPLMIIPVRFLHLLGWQTVDPVATRLVAAALFGIGLESFIGRNAGPQAYQGMLTLKIIWSVAAMIGIAVSMVSMDSPPISGWFLLGIFVLFNALWIYWFVRIRKIVDA